MSAGQEILSFDHVAIPSADSHRERHEDRRRLVCTRSRSGLTTNGPQPRLDPHRLTAPVVTCRDRLPSTEARMSPRFALSLSLSCALALACTMPQPAESEAADASSSELMEEMLRAQQCEARNNRANTSGRPERVDLRCPGPG